VAGGPAGESGSITTTGAYPLTFGTNNTARMTITGNGNVGIGTISPNSYKLAVEGTIGASEVVVTLTRPWPDYVFENEYELSSLPALEEYVRRNKHLPEIPTAEEIKEKGLSLGEMNTLMLKKVEELTLHLIEMNKQLVRATERIEMQQQEIEKLKNR
jgi:hypothetical protein